MGEDTERQARVLAQAIRDSQPGYTPPPQRQGPPSWLPYVAALLGLGVGGAGGGASVQSILAPDLDRLQQAEAACEAQKKEQQVTFDASIRRCWQTFQERCMK